MNKAKGVTFATLALSLAGFAAAALEVSRSEDVQASATATISRALQTGTSLDAPDVQAAIKAKDQAQKDEKTPAAEGGASLVVALGSLVALRKQRKRKVKSPQASAT